MKEHVKRAYESPSIEIYCVETEGVFSMSHGGGDINKPGEGYYYEFEIW